MDAKFDHEQLDVYRVGVEVEEVVVLWSRGNRELREQLDSALLSVGANIAEASGRRTRGEKVQFFGIARGSATEAGHWLEVAYRRKLVSLEVRNRARALLIRVVQMLSRLCR